MLYLGVCLLWMAPFLLSVNSNQSRYVYIQAWGSSTYYPPCHHHCEHSQTTDRDLVWFHKNTSMEIQTKVLLYHLDNRGLLHPLH